MNFSIWLKGTRISPFGRKKLIIIYNVLFVFFFLPSMFKWILSVWHWIDTFRYSDIENTFTNENNPVSILPKEISCFFFHFITLLNNREKSESGNTWTMHFINLQNESEQWFEEGVESHLVLRMIYWLSAKISLLVALMRPHFMRGSNPGKLHARQVP